MKNYILGLSSVILLLLVVACGNGSGNGTETTEGNETSGEQIVFRYAEVNSDDDPITEAARRFGEILEEETDGRISINVFSGGQLGGHADVMESVRSGTIDMARTQPSHLANAGFPELNVFSLPYLFENQEHANNVLSSSIGEDMLNSIEETDSNIIGLGHYITSPRNFFFTNTPVTTIEDMQGLKVRAQEGSVYTDMVEAFGASSTPLPFSELYSALQTGIVDGADNPIKGYHNQSFQEVAPYYTFSEHQIDPSIIVMSGQAWGQLNDEDKEIVKDALAQSREYFHELQAEEEQQYLENLESEGVEFSEIEDPQKWREAVEPLYEEYGEGSEELIEEIRNFE